MPAHQLVIAPAAKNDLKDIYQSICVGGVKPNQIGVHDAPESVFTFAQNMHLGGAFLFAGVGVDEGPRCGLTVRDTQNTRDAHG